MAPTLSLCGVPTLELLERRRAARTVITFRDALQAHAAGINRLNVYPVPDGDTGTNMALTLDAVVAELDGRRSRARRRRATPSPRLAHGGARQLRRDPVARSCAAWSSTLHGQRRRDRRHGRRPRSTAASAAAYTAVLKPVEGTILTVVREAAEAAERRGRRRRVAWSGVLARGARRRHGRRWPTRPSCSRC